MGTGKLRDPKGVFRIESERVLAICASSSMWASGVEITVDGSEMVVSMIELLLALEVRVLRELIVIVAGNTSALIFIGKEPIGPELVPVTISGGVLAKEAVSILLLVPDWGRIRELLVVKGLRIKRTGVETTEGAVVPSLPVTVYFMRVGLPTSLMVASIAVTMSLMS